jgi:SulP family sulfate permease
VRYVPVSIVIGFTNGIAVLIGLSQVKDFLGLQIAKMPADFFGAARRAGRHAAHRQPGGRGHRGGLPGGVVLWPKSYAMPTRAGRPRGQERRMAAHCRAPSWWRWWRDLVAVTCCGLPVETIGSALRRHSAGPAGAGTARLRLGHGAAAAGATLTIALLGAIESLLCARVADTMTDLPRTTPTRS